jgi:hypothetical protein
MNFWTPWNYVPKRLDDINWDYKAVLCQNDVVIEFDAGSYFDGGAIITPPLSEAPGWVMYWYSNWMVMGRQADLDTVCKGAALYIELYNRGISASLCEKLVRGYLDLTN